MTWITSTIGEVCDSGSGEVKTGPFGSQLHQSDYEEIGTPVVMPKDIVDGGISENSIARVGQEHVERLSQHKLSAGDIVYGRRGDIGRQALVKPTTAGWLCGTGCLRITLGEGPILPEFLHLYLRQDDVIEWIAKQAVGATMPNLNTSILRSIPVRYPSDRSEQQKIVDTITAYDNLIENDNRRIAILEEMAQSLYREWFVKFRFPGHENTKFIESPLGKIPEGWEVMRADELFNINIGKTPPRKEKQWFVGGSDGVKWLSIKDMGLANIYANTTNEGLTEEAVKKFNVKVVPKSTVVMSFKLTVGKVVILSDDMATNEAIAHFNAKDGSLMVSEYIYLYLSNFNFQTLGNTSSIGNAINSKVVKAMPVISPNEKAMRDWVEIVTPLFSQIKSLVSVVDNLKKQRDLILPKLISGAVTV